MNKSIEQIAKEFSLGKFELVFPYLSDNITWKIIGENTFKGRSDVVANCNRTLEYFNSVDTKFTAADVIKEKNKVVIIGTAEFFREGKRINFVEASDLYEFDISGKIKNITSYCISGKK